MHVIADVAGDGDAEVNALQRLARVAIAVDQGWGLPTAEALLKGTPVVAAPGPATKALVGRGSPPRASAASGCTRSSRTRASPPSRAATAPRRSASASS